MDSTLLSSLSLHLLSGVQIALHQPAAAGPGSGPVTAALIGAAAAVSGILIKDLGLAMLTERRGRKRSEAEVYRQYLAPLANACEKVVWRCHEVFVKRRHRFLRVSTLPLEFNAYKRQSTLYRLACVIGWIRGMSRELAAAPRRAEAFLGPVDKQIAAFQFALAEGDHVELHRLQAIASLWRMDLTSLSEAARDDLAYRFELELHGPVLTRPGTSGVPLRDLDDVGRFDVCTRLAGRIASATGQSIPTARVQSTLAEAVTALSYREAWIFRDWQDAIGDAMLEPDPDSVRRYRVIGYEAFCALIDTSTSPWFRALASTIEDLDLDAPNPSDVRLQQLKDVADASAAILLALAEIPEERFLVKDKIAKAAAALIAAS